MPTYDLGEARGRVVVDYDGRNLPQASTDIQSLGTAAERAGGSLEKTVDIIKKAGQVSLVAGGIIAGGFAAAVNSAADFEFQMDAIQAVSGATAEQMGEISKAALRIGKDTAFSASEAGLAMEELVKAGIPLEAVLNGAADATVALAAAGGVDLPTAATIAANAMNQFGLAASDLVHVTDQIAGAANASAIDMGQFAYSMSQVGAVAKLAGLTFDDTALAIAAMGNAGIVGSDAGTSLKQVLLNLNPSTEKQRDLMTELGIVTEDGANAFYTAEGRLKSLAEISDVLGGALAGMTDMQKQATLETLFGSDAIRGAAIIAKEGSAGFNALSESIGKVSAADVAATRMGNLRGALEQVGGSIETLMIGIGTVLIPALTDLANKISSIIDWLDSLDPEFRNFIVYAGLATSAILTLGGIVAIAGAALFNMRNQLIVATGATTLFGNAGAIAAVQTGILTAASKAFAGALALISAHPIIAIITAVAFLLVGLITLTKQWGAVGEAFAPVSKEFEKMKPVFEDVGKTFGKVGGELAKAFLPVVKTLIDSVLPPLVQIIMALLPVIEVLGQIVGKILAPAFKLIGVAVGVVAKVLEVLMKILGPIIDILSAILIPILNALEWVLSLVAVAVDWLAGAFENAFKEIGNWLRDAGEAFSAWYSEHVQPTVDKVMAVIGPFVDWFSDKVGKGLEVVMTWIGQLFEKSIAGWGIIWEKLQQKVGPVVDWFVAEVWPNLERGLKLVADKAMEFRDANVRAWEFIQQKIGPIVEWLVREVVDRVRTGFENLPGAIEEAKDRIGNAWEAIQSRVGPVVEWFKSNVIDPIVSFHASLGDTAQATGGRIGNAWDNIKKLVAPIVDWWVNEAMPKIGPRLEEIAGKAEQLRDKFVDAWEKIQERVQPIVDRWNNEILPKLSSAFDSIRDRVTDLRDKFTDAWDKMAEKVAPIAEQIIEIVGRLKGVFDRFFGGEDEGGGGGGGGKEQPTVDSFTRLMDALDFIVDFIVANLDLLIRAIDGVLDAFDFMSRAIQMTMGIIGLTVQTATAILQGIFSGDWSRMPDTVRRAWERLPDGIRIPIEGVVGLVAGVPQKVLSALGNLGGLLFNAGKQIIQGLIDGVNNMIQTLKDTLAKITTLIPKNKGPERVDKVLLYDNGQLIMQGLINGMRSEMNNLEGFLGGVTFGIPAELDGDVRNILNANGYNSNSDKPTGATVDFRQEIHTDADPVFYGREFGREFIDEIAGS